MSNKEAAEQCIEQGLDEDIDRSEQARRAALAGIGYALLGIADAIREGRAKLEEPRAGIAKDYHTEAIESGAGVLEDICATLESVRTEIADLRCTVAKLGGR